MEYQTPKSKCNLCDKEYTRKGLTRHLKSCINKKLYNANGIDHMYIVVQHPYNHDYFFHLLLSMKITLHDLDLFLRKQWLECCGHMSAFTFEKWEEEIPMSKMLSQIMAEGNTIQYEYDFGSTTELEVKCIGRFTTIMQGKKTIQVLSRNTEPLFPCDECGKHPAVQICTSCQWDGEGWLCKKCAEKHDCGDELYFLPVVNSPRAGVCDYSGE